MKYEFFSGPKPWNCDEDADDGDGDRKVPDTWEWQPYHKIFTILNVDEAIDQKKHVVKATDDYGADNNNNDDKKKPVVKASDVDAADNNNNDILLKGK